MGAAAAVEVDGLVVMRGGELALDRVSVPRRVGPGGGRPVHLSERVVRRAS